MGRLILILILILSPSAARAELSLPPYEGIRPSGMGNAFLAISDDENAIWYNPAALTQIKGKHLALLDVSLGVDSKNSLDRIDSAVFNGNYAGLIPQGKQYLRSGLQVTYVRQYFSLSVFDHLQSYTDLENLTNPIAGSITAESANDVGAILGFGLPINDFLSVGAAARVFERNSVNAQLSAQSLINQFGITSTNLLNDSYDYLKKLYGLGWGVGATTGALVTVPFHNKMAQWTIAATADDLGATSFHPIGSNPLPTTILPSYNAGTALKYLYGKKNELNIALDVQGIGQDLPFFKQGRFGIEYKTSIFGFRAGVYDGQPSYGLSLYAPPHTRVHLSSYAFETGPTIGSSPLRIYVVEIEIGFNPI